MLLSPIFPIRWLKLESDLTRQSPVAGFVRNLPERAGVDVQIRIHRRRVIEDISSVDPDRHALGFRDLELFLNIPIDIPTTGPIERVQSQAAQLPGRRILQDDVLSGGIGGDGGVAAE